MEKIFTNTFRGFPPPRFENGYPLKWIKVDKSIDLKIYLFYILMEKKEFYCDICSKYYKSYKSLWNHNKNIHDQKMTKKMENKENSDQKMTKKMENNNDYDQNMTIENTTLIKKTDITICEYCKKDFSAYTHLKRHQKKCTNKIEHETTLLNLKKENEEIKKQLADLKEQLIQMMNKKCKVHHKTLKKLINNTQNNATNQSINNGTVNNINNTFNIIPLGKEELSELFSKKEKLMILSKKYQSLHCLVEYVHFNKKYPQFQNIMITNNRTNEAHVYDPKTKSFIIMNKDELVTDLIEFRICDIEEFYGEFENELDDKTKDIFNNIFNNRGDDDDTKNDIKLLLFNNRKMVLSTINDIKEDVLTV